MYKRRSPRLVGFDYRTPKAYFITVVTWRRLNIFGDVDSDGVMARSDLGTVAEAEWWRTLTLYEAAQHDSFMLMPNHIHAIVWLNLEMSEGGARPARLTNLIGSYKASVSRRTGCRGMWQRSFYDHVIRNESDLDATRAYIGGNPDKWALDHENPAVSPPSKHTPARRS